MVKCKQAKMKNDLQKPFVFLSQMEVRRAIWLKNHWFQLIFPDVFAHWGQKINKSFVSLCVSAFQKWNIDCIPWWPLWFPCVFELETSILCTFLIYFLYKTFSFPGVSLISHDFDVPEHDFEKMNQKSIRKFFNSIWFIFCQEINRKFSNTTHWAPLPSPSL